MRLRRSSVLQLKIANLHRLLTARLELDANGDEIEQLAHQLDLLEGLARRRRRHRSLTWLAGAAVVALVAAVFLRFSALPRADIAVVADTRAFTLTNGAGTQNIFPTGLVLRAVTVPDTQLTRCTDPSSFQAKLCDGAAALRLNSFFLNTRAVVGVRKTGSCVELELLNGGASAELSVQATTSHEVEHAAANQWSHDHITMTSGDTMVICPSGDASFECVGPSSVMIADRLEVSRAKEEDRPALAKARLSILDTSQVTEFRRTDIPRFDHLSNSMFVARLRDPIEVSLVGNTARMAVETGPYVRDLMPSRLDWVRGSPLLKASLAVLSAILGALVAVRERWLGELG